MDPSRIGVLGESMGGEEAIGAMEADPRLRVAVAEGTTNRTAEDRGWPARGSSAWSEGSKADNPEAPRVACRARCQRQAKTDHQAASEN